VESKSLTTSGNKLAAGENIVEAIDRLQASMDILNESLTTHTKNIEVRFACMKKGK